MKTFSRLWQYLPKFYVEWEMFWINVVEKIKAHVLLVCWITFCFRKSCRLWDNVEKCGGNWGAIIDFTIWHIRVACWISKATCTGAHATLTCSGIHTHAHTDKYVILIPFRGNNDSRTRLIVNLYVHCLSCLCHNNNKLNDSKKARSWIPS